jgi:hypothetical protein
VQEDREYRQAITDLAYLLNEGALTGAAEIIRERRRQIEQKGYTPEHDREQHSDGFLAQRASWWVRDTMEGIGAEAYGPAEARRQFTISAALAAAEIDRLAAEFDPEPATYRCWRELGGHTHHVHGPGQPCPVYGDRG